MKKKRKRIFWGGRVSIRFSVVFLVVKMFSSGTMKILPVSLKNQELKYLDLQYLDIFHSNATYVKGLQEKYNKNNGKALQSRVIR